MRIYFSCDVTSCQLVNRYGRFGRTVAVSVSELSSPQSLHCQNLTMLFFDCLSWRWSRCCLSKRQRTSDRKQKSQKTCFDVLLTVHLSIILVINRLTPNDPYMGRNAPLTSKCCILYIYSTNISTEYFKHALYSPFFLFKMQFVS